MKSRYLIVLLLLIPVGVHGGVSIESDPVATALTALDREFDQSFRWWSRVYDPESGGCTYALSGKEAARTDPQYGPDIESTQKLVNVLQWTGLLEASPTAFKQGVIRYLQARQDPDSGLFRDPQHQDQYTHNTLTRVTAMALGTLESCGGKPLYPTPLERTGENEEAAAHFAHLASPEALHDWLQALPWETRVWTAGNRLRAQSDIFQQLPEPKRSALLDVVEQFVLTKQRKNGFFGAETDHWTSRLSGTYKIAGFLHLNGLSIPEPEAIKETVLDHLQNRDYQNSIVLYNTANILNILHRSAEPFDMEERLDIVHRCTRILHTMRTPDGGFVTNTRHPTPVEMGKRLSLEVVEANSNATGLAHKTRLLLIELLTDRPPPHSHPGGYALVEALDEMSERVFD